VFAIPNTEPSTTDSATLAFTAKLPHGWTGQADYTRSCNRSVADAPFIDGDALESDVVGALSTGHSANLIVHAFAQTARRCGIDTSLVAPFFESMRTDLVRTRHDDASLERYIYGSAEVVGLMCLRAFLADEPGGDEDYASLTPGARHLGAAFQKINFLRDLGEDGSTLGRCYFPGVDPTRLTDDQRDALLDDIDADLRLARAAIPHLPSGSRRAVDLAYGLFTELSDRMRVTPAEELCRRRTRVPGPVKARIAARVLLSDRL
jgi:phytoene/squalene synthetase